MTVLLFAVGGAAAALGTRLSALAFVGAAVLGARHPSSSIAAASTWTAALAAALVLLDDGSPRRHAVPALGAAALLAAAGAPNGAVVLGLWVLATTAAVVSRGFGSAGRRWALLLGMSDVLVAAAVATTTGLGFQGWPFTLRPPGIVLLAAAAVVRAPLCAGSDERSSSAGLVVVRLQAVLLVAFATAAGTSAEHRTILVAGAVGFAVAGWASRRAVVDASQEVALVAMAMAGSGLQFVPSGWAWGALAAGTLMHQLRFTLARRPSGPFMGVVHRSAGIGLPFLPVVVAQLEGTFRAREWISAIVALAILGGLAGRTRTAPDQIRRGHLRTDPVRSWLPAAAAIAAAFWAPLLSLPRPPGGGRTSWPDAWALCALVALVAVGSQLGGVVTERHSSGEAGEAGTEGGAVFGRFRRATRDRTEVIDRWAAGPVLWIVLGVVTAAAIALWLAGLARGFL